MFSRVSVRSWVVLLLVASGLLSSHLLSQEVVWTREMAGSTQGVAADSNDAYVVGSVGYPQQS